MYRLEDRLTASSGTVFLSGTQALARLAVDQLRADRAAGRRTAALVSGYPGSPLGGFDRAATAAARANPDLAISCRPALNEEYAATAIMGSQLAQARPDSRYDGVVGLWYGKAPGVDRATDALRHAVYAGTAPLGGVVALIGDDPGAKSSTLPSSSVGVLQDLHIPVLYPADVAAALTLGRHAIALSRYSGLWSALKIVADVADGTGSVALDDSEFFPVLPDDDEPVERTPDGWLLTPHTLDIEREIYEIRYERARRYAAANRLNEIVVDGSAAWIGIVASGITYAEVRAACSKLGLHRDADIAGAGIRLLNMRMPLPFDPATLVDFARGLDEILVIEEKQPHLETLIMAALYGSAQHPVITGKADPTGRQLVPGHGALDRDAIADVLRRRLEPRLAGRLAPEQPARELIPVNAPARTPYFCSGCPHNRSTEVPEGALVGAGIGCHTMTLLMEPDRVGDIVGLTPMGNEGTQWIGMSDFVDTDHFIQNLGDGTFFHSGQLAVTAAVAAGVNMTYKLLFNGAIAMTGGQHPEGQRDIASVARVLLDQGATEVLITSDQPQQLRRLPKRVKVWDRSRIVEAQTYLAGVPGVTVLIHDQPCAAELRRARKRQRAETPTQQVSINHRICEGCGDCGRVSNCLSVQPVETAFGRKTRIDHSTCNLDFSCLDGDCPSFVTVDTAPSRWRIRPRREIPVVGDPAGSDGLAAFLAGPVPDPVVLVDRDDYSCRIAGIGGTGIVTVAQVIGTAAMLGGYAVRGLDQVGLSQKAGPVVSDLRLSRSATPESNHVGAGQADLLLVLDLLVGSTERSIATVDPKRTMTVGSTTLTSTGAMVRHPDLSMPTAVELTTAIAARTDPDRQWWADMTALAEQAFGSALTANMIGVGMALQAGAIPVPADTIETAIELNAAAVDANRSAFRLGRLLVHDPASVHAVLAARSEGGRCAPMSDARLDTVALDALPGETRTEAVGRAIDLIGFQDVSLANRYLQDVASIASLESRVRAGSHELSLSAARNLYRVLAYKDEYEVARLLVDPEGRAEAIALAGAAGRIRYRLHPPALRALGRRRKLSVGTWSDPLFKALAAAKRVRGTRLDPFGRTEVRRAERGLITDYRRALDLVLRHTVETNFDVALMVVALPDQVRGYEDLKLARIEQFRADLEELLPVLLR